LKIRPTLITFYWRDLFRLIVVLSTLCTAAGSARAIPLTASVDQGAGLPLLSFGGVTAMSSGFAFWGNSWTWAQLKSQFKIIAPFEYSISGTNKLLNFDLSGKVSKPSDRQLTWDFNLDSSVATADVIGGGITFLFDLANFKSEFGVPELLANNSGWTWGRPGSREV